MKGRVGGVGVVSEETLVTGQTRVPTQDLFARHLPVLTLDRLITTELRDFMGRRISRGHQGGEGGGG